VKVHHDMEDTGTDRIDEALGLIFELVVLLNDDMTRSLARDGLTPSRAHVLWELRERGPSAQKDLADAMDVSARNITGLVDALVETGFVTREPHPTDRRATLVSFTSHGARTADALKRGQQELARLLFSGMPAERLDCFAKGMGEVLTRLYDHGVSRDREAGR
jgi:DNA-binding MarR family transcriptional regulator